MRHTNGGVTQPSLGNRASGFSQADIHNIRQIALERRRLITLKWDTVFSNTAKCAPQSETGSIYATAPGLTCRPLEENYDFSITNTTVREVEHFL